MHKRCKRLVVALTAAFMLAVTVSTASAGNLSVSEVNFRLSWPRLTFAASGFSVTCEVNLGGSFHSRTIRKVARSLVGVVTEARLETCADGSATVLTETLPWHVTYNTFTGTLPNITSVKLLLVRASFRASEGTACLAQTDTAEPLGLTAAISGGQITALEADESFAIDLDDPGFFCGIAGDARMSGRAAMCTPSVGLIAIRLI